MLTLLLAGLLTFELSFAGFIDEPTARKAGMHFLKQRGIAVDEPLALKETRSAAGETLYYIYNNGEQGFVIVSADDRVVPVLGYSSESAWAVSPDTVYGCNVHGWMKSYEDQIMAVKATDLPASEEIRQQWAGLLASDKPLKDLEEVQPLLTTTWNQLWPYNEACPADAGGSGGHTLVGCVGVAMAQILKYWAEIETGLGSYTYGQDPYGTLSADYGNTVYHWENMPASISASNLDVATLMFHAAVSCGSQFGPTATNVGWVNDREPMSRAYLNYFKKAYSSLQFVSMSPGWEEVIKAELDAVPGRPVHYRGDGVGSHQWVCDGYSGSDYFHFNFGWGGAYDGYYYLTSINPGTYNFTNNQQAIIGIKPNDGSTIIANATWSGTQNKTTKTAIADGITLTLSPGANLKFAANTWLQVYGNINAIGTQADSITISAIDTTAGWLGIKLDNQYMDNTVMNDNDTSRFVYCRISYADNHAVYLSYINKIKIDRSRLHNNYDGSGGGGAIESYTSKLKLTNSKLDNNNTSMIGGAMLLHHNSYVEYYIYNNIFVSNHAIVGYGGAIYASNGDASMLIENNTFQYNSAGGGGALSIAAGSPMIRSNKFVNNTTPMPGFGAVYFSNNTNTSFVNNLVSNNTGSGLRIQQSSPMIVNTTITNNLAYSYGGGVRVVNNSNPNFKNCVLYGNEAPSGGSQISLENTNCDPNFYYCDIQGGVAGFGGPGAGGEYNGIYENNLDLDPYFTDPSDGTGVEYDGLAADWQLLNDSPCIDAGTPDTTGLNLPDTDLAGNPRVFGSRADMGAYEWFYVGMNEPLTENENQTLITSPNPFTGELHLIYTLNRPGKATIVLYDATGRPVATLLSAGYQTGGTTGAVSWNSHRLPAGMYYVVVAIDGVRTSAEIVLKR